MPVELFLLDCFKISSGRSIRTDLQVLFQILLYLFKAPIHRASNGALMDALCPCYFGISFAEDYTGVHPAALRFGQRIECSAQMAEQFHALQQLLRGGFRNAGRVFDPVLAIEGILCLVADNTPLIGGLIQPACIWDRTKRS